MSDIASVLAASYKSTPSSAPSHSKYVAVDPKLYEGHWTGKYSNNKSFSVDVTQVDGFRAKVRYQSSGISKYQDVLIKDLSFRFGDTKFVLTGDGKAQIANVVTDPATGSTFLDKAQALRSK